jgi:DHA1 family bicyclomycin/chloramphenicol resistance-like MFS transporter
VLDAFRQTVTNRQTLGYALAAGGVLGSLFAFVFISQQVFTGIYQLGHYFPLAFAGIAIGTAIAGFRQLPLRRPPRHARDFARRAGRLRRRGRDHAGGGESCRCCRCRCSWRSRHLMMFAFGLMIANFTALAMEPQGHIAGTASSLYGSITTLLGIGIGTTIGQDYDGTLLPFATGFFLCTLAALAVVLVVEKGRLFSRITRPLHAKGRPARYRIAGYR